VTRGKHRCQYAPRRVRAEQNCCYACKLGGTVQHMRVAVMAGTVCCSSTKVPAMLCAWGWTHLANTAGVSQCFHLLCLYPRS
jgi:hypothetical protein